MRSTKARADRFGREFHVALWRSYQELGANAKRGVYAALAVLVVFVATGARREVLIGCSAMAAMIWVGLYRRSPPAARHEQLRDVDVDVDVDERPAVAVRDVEDGAGGLIAYEQVVDELEALVDRSVTVLVGAGAGAGGPSVWRTAGMLMGRLRHPGNISDDPANEVLFFAVGEDDGGFFVDRRAFEVGEVLVHATREGLELTRDDGAVIAIRPQANDR